MMNGVKCAMVAFMVACEKRLFVDRLTNRNYTQISRHPRDPSIPSDKPHLVYSPYYLKLKSNTKSCSIGKHATCAGLSQFPIRW